MGRPRALHILLAACCGVGAVVAVANGGTDHAVAAANCGAVAEGSIAERTAFNPYPNEGFGLLPVPINGNGQPSAELRGPAVGLDTLDSLAPTWAADLGDGAQVVYFSKSAISSETLPEDFFAQGGIQIEMGPIGETPFHRLLAAAFPDRVVDVRVGLAAGVMTWADPLSNGVRTHNVYWSDGTHDYALIADRSAASALSLARVIACH